MPKDRFNKNVILFETDFMVIASMKKILNLRSYVTLKLTFIFFIISVVFKCP